MATYTRERMKSLRIHLRQSRGWSLQRFAAEIQFSTSLVKKVEAGDRNMTPAMVKALKRLERDQAYVAKETQDEETQVLDWLLTALEGRRAELTGTAIRRLRKLLEGIV